MKNLNICKYTSVRICDEYGINKRFYLLFQEVCTLKNLTTPYVLPIASASVLGGIKVGSGLTINAFTGVLSTSGGGGTSSHFSLTSSNFEVDGKSYVDVNLIDDNTSIFWNDINRFIYKDQAEWEYSVGGGFKILLPEFDASINNVNIEIFTK